MLPFVAIAGLPALAGALAVISALRRRVDELTSERARLERALSDFAATASHELRSPLTSIKGFVELLHRSADNLSDRQREFVEIILESTERLGELVGELLDVGRIEADRVKPERRPIDLGEALREVAQLMGPRFAAKHQLLTVGIAPALPLALAEPAHVRQIVANLLTNAHLYTGVHGRIHVSAEPERAWVKLAVTDSGLGLTAEQAGRVFERFYRADDAAQMAPGTGLGLSIVKSLVELHDGQVEVESAPGCGSTFRVLIPAAVPVSELTSTLDAIRGRRVLVVDDEIEIAELIAGQLAPLGVSSDLASSGSEALAMLRASHYDAVTLDVLMPGMDGAGVLERIRADPELRATPTVFVSVLSARHEFAGEWVVSKPIDPDELRHVLGAAIRVSRPPVEVALVDAGVRHPRAVLDAIDLRGRRWRTGPRRGAFPDEPVPRRTPAPVHGERAAGVP